MSVYDKELIDDESTDEIKDQVLPKFDKNQKITLSEVNVKKSQTKPPARFTEATLLSAMENPQRFVKEFLNMKGYDFGKEPTDPSNEHTIYNKIPR